MADRAKKTTWKDIELFLMEWRAELRCQIEENQQRRVESIQRNVDQRVETEQKLDALRVRNLASQGQNPAQSLSDVNSNLGTALEKQDPETSESSTNQPNRESRSMVDQLKKTNTMVSQSQSITDSIRSGSGIEAAEGSEPTSFPSEILELHKLVVEEKADLGTSESQDYHDHQNCVVALQSRLETMEYFAPTAETQFQQIQQFVSTNPQFLTSSHQFMGISHGPPEDSMEDSEDRKICGELSKKPIFSCQEEIEDSVTKAGGDRQILYVSSMEDLCPSKTADDLSKIDATIDTSVHEIVPGRFVQVEKQSLLNAHHMFDEMPKGKVEVFQHSKVIFVPLVVSKMGCVDSEMVYDDNGDVFAHSIDLIRSRADDGEPNSTDSSGLFVFDPGKRIRFLLHSGVIEALVIFVFDPGISCKV